MRNLLSSIVLFFAVNNLLYAQNCSINAGLSTTICQSEIMTLNGTRSGLLGTNSVSTWTQISGPAVVLNTPNSLVTTVSGYDVGTYVFRLSIKCRDGLLAEDFVTIGVEPITIANAGVDTSFCPGTSFLFANAPRNNDETGAWTINSLNNAGVTIQSPSNPNSPIVLSNNAIGLTTLRWTIVNNNGCTTFDEVIIKNIGGVSPVNAGPDQILGNCFSNTTCATLSASNGGIGNNGQIGIWSLVSGPSIPTVNPIDRPATKVCNLIEGTYIFRYTVQGPCASGFDDVMVEVPAPTQDITTANANALGGSALYCGLVNTITLNGNAPLYAGETVLWTQTSGPTVIITTPENPSTTVTGLNTFGNYCFSYSIINNSSNCQKTSTICYTLYETGTLNAGADQLLPCNITVATITPVKTGTGTLNYRIISGPIGVFTYPTVYKASNVITGMTKPGTYRVEVNYVFGLGCPAISDFIDLTVSRPPTGANAGTDQSFACTSTTTQLAGNNPLLTGFGTGRWSLVSGPNLITLVPLSNYVCNVTGTIPGVYVFRWTISGGNACPENFDDINVIIPDTTLTMANAGNDRTVCSNSPITLYGNNFRVDETVKWTSIPFGVTFSPNNTVANPIVSGLIADTSYSFIYAISNSCGNISYDTVKIRTSASVGISTANAGQDQCLPSGSAVINLNANNPSSGIGKWKQVSGTSVNISDSTLYNTTVTGITNGNYKFVWTISIDGCSNTSSDTVFIIVSGTTSTANAGADVVTCANEYTLNGNTPVFGTGKWTQVSGDGSALIVSATNPTTLVTNLVTGIYVFRWTISNSACVSNYDDVTITISLPPSSSNAGNDQTLCGVNAGSTTLNASPPSVGTGQWVQLTGPNIAVISNRALINTNISGLTNGTYIFRWIVTGGPSCPQSTDDVFINIGLPSNAGTDQSLCNLTSSTLRGNIGSSGIWSQVSGLPVVLTQNPVGNPIASVSGFIQGNSYTFRYTIPATFGCPATFDEVTVNNGIGAFVPNAGNDTSYCNVTSFSLNGSLPGVGETGTWSVLSGPSGSVFLPNANSPNAILSSATPGVYILRWNISNAVCSSSDVKRVDNYALPSIANAGANQTVCYEKATLNGNIPVDGIGTWTQIAGPTTTIAAINNPTSVVTGLNTIGIYKYIWTISNGMCSKSQDTVNLIVSALSPTIANAGNDINLCNQTVTQLNGNLPAIGNGVWTNIGTTNATIISPNANVTSVELSTTGTYQFVWTIKNADESCTSNDTIKVINSVQPNIASAGIDDTFCVFSNIILNANTAIAGTTGTWSLVSGPNIPRFVSPNNSVCQLTGVITGNYKFLWTISSPFCSSSSDELNITIINNADLAIAGINQSICANNTTFSANFPTGTNKGIWTQVSGPTLAIINSVSDPISNVTNLIAGKYRFVWKIYNARCFTTDTVDFIIREPATVYAGNDFSACSNNSPFLLSDAVVSSPDSTARWSIISGGGTLSTITPTTQPNTVLYTPEPFYNGAVILRLSAEDSCSIVTDDITILIKETTLPIVAVDDRITTNPNTSIIVNVLANDTVFTSDILNLCNQNSIITLPVNGTVQVNIDGTIIYVPISNFSGIDSFQYQICVEQENDSIWQNNCFVQGADSAWVFIAIEDESCVIPNAFSPNGDGINDLFEIPCLNSSDIRFSVYNSWGIQLYQNENYLNDWNGMYKGSPLPDGTYYYIIRYNTSTNELFHKAGFITLHR